MTAAVYEDTLSGCPTRSTNTASINDATSISSANPRAYRPGPLTPLDANSASSLPLNSTFDPWSDPSTCHPFPAPAMPPCRCSVARCTTAVLLVLQGPHSNYFSAITRPAGPDCPRSVIYQQNSV